MRLDFLESRLNILCAGWSYVCSLIYRCGGIHVWSVFNDTKRDINLMMHFKPTQFDIWNLKRKVILAGRGISGRWRREESGVQVEPVPVLASVSYNTCLNPPPAHAKCLPSPDRHLISEREKTAPSPAPLTLSPGTYYSRHTHGASLLCTL